MWAASATALRISTSAPSVSSTTSNWRDRLGRGVVAEDEVLVHQEPGAGGVDRPIGPQRLDEVGEHRVRLVVEVEREVVERPPGEVRATARPGRGAEVVEHQGERVDAVDERLHPAVRVDVAECSVEPGRAGGEPARRVEQLQVRPQLPGGDLDRAAGRCARPALVDAGWIDVPCGLVAGVHRPAGRDATVVGEPAHRHVAGREHHLAHRTRW